MKKNYLLKLIGTYTFLFYGVASNAQTIKLTPTATGSEANSLYTDASILQISAGGVVSYYNSNSTDDWTINAETITQTNALGKTFKITWGGMFTVNTTEGSNYGKKLTNGGVDRDNSGLLGIRGINGDATVNSGGIDMNEGYYFGLDLSNLGTDVAVQITKISVAQLSGTLETGIAVSLLNPTKRINFGPGNLTSGTGTIDLSAMQLYAVGGTANDNILSVFNNSATTNSWRISGIELKVIAVSALPVTLKSFKATTTSQAVKLTWETLAEQNSKEFILMHGTNDSSFETIAMLPAAGNSNSTKNYQVYDRNAVNGINYYKLIQVDNDGKKNEVATQAVRFELKTDKTILFPNPTTSNVTVSFAPGTYNTLNLTDVSGKILQTIAVGKVDKGTKLNLSQYVPGIYMLKLEGEKTKTVSKLVKR